MFELSEAALAVLENTVFATEVSVAEAAEDALTRPGDSFWRDDELWVTHTLMFATPDRSQTDDYLYDYSNYRVALRELSEEFPSHVEDAGFGHWTYSQFVCVKVRVLDENGQITPAFVKAYDLARQAEEYIMIDEFDYMELEGEVQDEYVREWANDNGVEPDLVFEAWYENDIYVEGVGSGFTILGENGETDGLPWDERDAALVKLIHDAHTRRLAAEQGAVTLEGV